MNARDILIKPIVTEKSTALMAVSTMRMEGKKKRMGRFEGKRSDWKKAIVTLKEGETIELFEGV